MNGRYRAFQDFGYGSPVASNPGVTDSAGDATFWMPADPGILSPDASLAAPAATPAMWPWIIGAIALLLVMR